MTTPNRITVRLASGQYINAILHSYVNLQMETGIIKTALFLGENGEPDFVAGQHMGDWSEIAEIAGRPAIDAAREVLAPYKSPEDVHQRFRGTVHFNATSRLITHLEKRRKERAYRVHLYCLPDGTYDIMRQNPDFSVMEPFAVAEYSCGCWEAGPTFGLNKSNPDGPKIDEEQTSPSP